MQAEAVFTARVVDVTAEVLTDKALAGVYTTVTFEIEEVFTGPALDESLDRDDSSDAESDEELNLAEQGRLSLDFLGGEAPGDRRLLVAGSPAWRTGEDVLVAAHLDPDLASPLVGFRQGVWRLSGDAYVDEDGQSLSIDAAGRLVRGELPALPAEVLQAVRRLFEEGPLDPETEAAAEVETEEVEGEPETEPEAEPETEPELEDPAAEPETAASEAGEPEAEEHAIEEPTVEEPTVEEPTTPAEPLSVTYRVDDAGGPLLLSDAVTDAAEDWRAAVGEALDLTASDTSSNEFGYGPVGLFSPATLSLTLVDADGVRVVVSPAAGEASAAALHHELGLLLGLPAGGPGVMAMAVSAGRSPPGAAEAAELQAVSRFPPADLSRDGVVDFLDLLEFSQNYGSTGLNLAGDLDADGDVDDDDLEVLKESYGFTPPRSAP